MKKFAIYLPQFHEIPENNKWWGEGFTEWVNVKRAKPLFKGHQQPKIPLNRNFYDLTNVETMEWQNEIARANGIDGFVFYHYYFNGKLLLNKPVENLLKNSKIDREFFFCWANHSWKKTWNGTNQLLIEQTYGDKEEWINHFSYLLPFFKDSRYLKINNKPVFMIFKKDFKEYVPMFECLDHLCKSNGFAGILIIESAHYFRDTCSQISQKFETRVYYREPAISTFLFNEKNRYSIWHIKTKLYAVLIRLGFKAHVREYDGEKLFQLMISYANKIDRKDIPGAFFEWDNTPRHKYRGYIITPPSKDTFQKYMETIKEHDLVIFNAWNEWAEGMIMEPTEQDGYKYLEWVKELSNEFI